MTFAVILIIIVAVIEVAFFGYTVKYASDVAERELALDKQEVSLDERELKNKEDIISLAESEAEMVEIRSTYVVTESDTMRYNSEKAIYNVARNRIAHNIAYDIIHKFSPSWDGNKMEYRFKIKEQE